MRLTDRSVVQAVHVDSRAVKNSGHVTVAHRCYPPEIQPLLSRAVLSRQSTE